MIGVSLVVDLGDDLTLVALGTLTAGGEPMLTARIAGGRQSPGEVQRRRTEERWIDAVVRERRAQRDWPALIALGGSERRKVAGQHRRGGHEREVVVRRLTQIRALVAAKEKEPVLDNRPAQRSAKLVTQQTVILPLAVRPHRRKLIGRVEPLVPVELEQVPVDDVGSRLRHRIDRGSRAHAVVGGEAARGDAELLQRIREDRKSTRLNSSHSQI